MKFIVGTKEKMTQVFDEEGRVHPATVVKVTPNVVTQIKGKEKDGYDAVQVGVGEKKEKNVNKAQRSKGNFALLKEFRLSDTSGIEGGKTLGANVFEKGDKVDVSAISKGKGFQGVVKRHNFAGGPRSHGQKHSEREPGSIGATGPQRVFKGTKMAGRMGGTRVTVKNLPVLHVDEKEGILLIHGAIPGRRGTVVELRSSVEALGNK